jgi:hypothetical protein
MVQSPSGEKYYNKYYMRKTAKNQLEINTKFSIAKNALLVNTTVHVPRTEQNAEGAAPRSSPVSESSVLCFPDRSGRVERTSPFPGDATPFAANTVPCC